MKDKGKNSSKNLKENRSKDKNYIWFLRNHVSKKRMEKNI